MKSKTILLVMLSLIMITGVMKNAEAQKYQKAKEVEYFQLPAINDTYKTANVFVMYDNALTHGGAIGGGGEKKGFGFDIGKLAGKLGDKLGGTKPQSEKTLVGKGIGKLGEAMKKAVAEAMKSKATPHETWNLFPPHFSNGKGKLKVVVTYSPYEAGRPMKPHKTNKGLYIVPFEVFAHVKVFDANKKLITDRNFGLVSGVGYSSEWPESGGSMFEVKVTEEGENAHPYDDVCRDGALDQARRVVYGMYGIKKIKETLGVYSFKAFKESSDYAKKYEKVIERKGEALLNANEISFMKECVSYWDGLLNKVAANQKWAVHHNLAIGYAWLLDTGKAKEQVSALKKLQKPTFSKIQKFFSGNAEKGTFIGNKDLNRLKVFNACYPFMEFYANGVKKHPTWPSILDKDYEELLYAFTMNNLIAGIAKLPFPLPIIPAQQLQSSPKKLSGSVHKNGELMMEFAYKLKKGKIIGMTITTPKGKGKINKYIAFGDIFADGSDDGSIGKSTYILRGVRAHKPLGVTPKGYYSSVKLKNAITPLPFKYEGLKYWELDGSMDVDFIPDTDFFSKYSNSGFIYLQGDSWDQCGAKISMTSSNKNEAGYPQKVDVKWELWGYTNSDSANNFLKKEVPGSKFDSKYKIMTNDQSKSYTLNWKFNSTGDWKEIKIGDITVSRSF